MPWMQWQQPSTLEHLATVKMADWISLHAETLMNPISNPHNYDDANKAETSLSQQIETIKNYFLKHMPGMLQNKLLTMLLYQLDELLYNIFPSRGWEDFTEPYHQRHVADRMLETLFTKNLTFLTLDYDILEIFGTPFSSKSYMLTGLTKLTLDIEYSKYFNENTENNKMESMIIQLLKGLRNLKELSITICSDNIIKCVAKNCRLIEKLELHNYFSISNSCIDMITQLPYLRSVELNESQIYLDERSDYQRLDHRKGKILENIASQGIFEIKSFTNYSESALDQLQLVAKTYPSIRRLCFKSIFLDQTLEGCLKLLNDLENLRQLEIYFYDFYSGQVKEVLEVVGAKLQEIQLVGVEKLNLNALKHISLTCPHLQSLSIIECSYNEKPVVNDFTPSNIEVPSFKKLQRFIFNLKYSSKNLPEDSIKGCILFLLSNCPNVEYVDIRSSYITNEVMIQVLDKNPLSCLKDLRVFHELSKPVMDLIVENCNEPEVTIYAD